MRSYDNGDSLRAKLKSGVQTLCENVASTLGPRGRTVLLHQHGHEPFVTKDGVTVARFVDFKDPFSNMAAQLVKQAAEKTNQEAGDGTTTTTILTHAIYNETQKYLASEVPPLDIKRGMDKAVEFLIQKIKEKAIPIKSIDDIQNIATVSANGDKSIGKLIAKAVDMIGKDGTITIEEARSLETSLELVEGFRFDSGYLAAAFITDEKRATVKYDNPLILVTDEKIETVEEMMPALEIAARESRPFVLVGENIEGQALAALIMNTTRGTLRCAGIKAPRYGEERRSILKDLCLSIGATLISRENGLKLRDVKLTHFGEAKRFESSKRLTTLVGGNGNIEEVEKQIEKLKAILADTDGLQECEKIQERISRLASGVAIIRVGAATEVEMTEKKHRVEDALEAVNAARLEGLLPGGAIALIQICKKYKKELHQLTNNTNEKIGIKIIEQSVHEPLRQMCLNAGISSDLIIEKVKTARFGNGYDFSTFKMTNLVSAGIADPAKVTRCALQNATSVASTLIATNYAIVEDGTN